MRDASELFMAMDAAIERDRHVRRSTSIRSPQQAETVEAEPGCVFTMQGNAANVPTQRPVSAKWALANLLHFFAATERAESLANYNQHAGRFAPNGTWVGAYGAIAVPQLTDVIMELAAHDESRRAFVSMGEMHPMDLNRPACWNHLHFLKWRGKLDMLVEQRSLMLHGVMAYDCVVLTNVLCSVASFLRLDVGVLRWRIGSLHKLADHPAITDWTAPRSIYVPYNTLRNPRVCEQWLNEPSTADAYWASILTGDS